MSFPERLYRFLIKAYPARYLRVYGEPMTQLFRDQVRAARSGGELTRLWLRTLKDLARTIPARYLESARYRPPLSGYSGQARYALFYARYTAVSSRSSELTIEHLLLGALREDRALADSVVGRQGYDAIAQIIAGPLPAPKRGVHLAHLPLSVACKRVLANAENRARNAHTKITTRHLLAAILDHPQSLAARLLRDHTVNLSVLKNDGRTN